MKRNVLFLDPFHTGSHRQFSLGWRSVSNHEVNVFAGAGRHWKWRMRAFAVQCAERMESGSFPEQIDLIITTSMTDVATLRGLSTTIARHPIGCYFHENQFRYPIREGERIDYQAGWMQLMTLRSSDSVAFNSHHNLETFFAEAEAFLRRMPDATAGRALDVFRDRCRVIPAGYDVWPVSHRSGSGDTIRLGWVSRWAHDKRPDRFLSLLKMLEVADLDFRLILLGPGQRDRDPAWREICHRFASRLNHAATTDDFESYREQLQRIDLVVSTADHEFFGTAICEAIHAGATAVVPDGLAYDDYIDTPCRYQNLEQAADIIRRLASSTELAAFGNAQRRSIERFERSRVSAAMDQWVEDILR